QYIARFTIQNAKELDITVATSDGMVQLIIRGEDSKLMSARELLEDVKSIRGGRFS
ncbi:MAG: NYN domain-containing protein, partial [Lachnospiraceae bacterium]|nr:NYN domain-containing protein [Lachnospiraceae bacterium]